MGFVASVNFFIALFYDTIRRVFVWRVWLLLVAYFLFHWLVLYAHYKFYSPFFYGLVMPWTEALDHQSALGFIHYPGQFLTLPFFFGWAKFILSIPFEGPVLGVIAIMLYRTYSGQYYSRPNSTRQWLYVYLRLVIAWLAVEGVMMLINTYLPELLSSTLNRAPRRIFVFRYMFLPGIHILLLSLFYFVVLYVVVHQASFFGAVRWSAKNFLNRPITCLFLAAIILAVPIAVSLILYNSPALVERLQPEAVYWVLLGGLAADMLVRFFWMGTAVRFILQREY